ncbi:cupin domain-containing protein [soil metagenome]
MLRIDGSGMGKQRHELSAFDLELGSHLRRLRHARALSLQDVAQRAEVSHSFLSQVENGKARPSFGSLDLIARALGSSRAEVTAAAGARSEAAAPRDPTVTYRHGASTVLHQDGSPLTVLRIEYTGTEPSEVYTHPEPEVVYLLGGRAEVRLGDALPQVLEAGQSVVYEGGTPHSWRAVDEGGFQALLVKQNPLPASPKG